jgi:hypothetical protein
MGSAAAGIDFHPAGAEESGQPLNLKAEMAPPQRDRRPWAAAQRSSNKHYGSSCSLLSCVSRGLAPPRELREVLGREANRVTEGEVNGVVGAP